MDAICDSMYRNDDFDIAQIRNMKTIDIDSSGTNLYRDQGSHLIIQDTLPNAFIELDDKSLGVTMTNNMQKMSVYGGTRISTHISGDCSHTLICDKNAYPTLVALQEDSKSCAWFSTRAPGVRTDESEQR